VPPQPVSMAPAPATPLTVMSSSAATRSAFTRAV
jgi:hypothetical protein